MGGGGGGGDPYSDPQLDTQLDPQLLTVDGWNSLWDPQLLLIG